MTKPEEEHQAATAPQCTLQHTLQNLLLRQYQSWHHRLQQADLRAMARVLQRPLCSLLSATLTGTSIGLPLYFSPLCSYKSDCAHSNRLSRSSAAARDQPACTTSCLRDASGTTCASTIFLWWHFWAKEQKYYCGNRRLFHRSDLLLCAGT